MSDIVGDEPAGSLRTAAITCSIGVMPVPPAIIPSFVQRISFRPILKRPLPMYSFMPIGPWMSSVSPACAGRG